MTPHKGHVQVAFERRTGRTLTAWLLENGPTMTLTEAAQAVGYAGHNPLTEFVARYLPESFRFHRVPPMFSVDEVEEAIVRHSDGETWAAIAIDYRRDVTLLKDACRRYRKRLRDGTADRPGKAPLLTADDIAMAFELRCIGESLDAIADHLGVSRRYLSSRLMQCERDGIACISSQYATRCDTISAHK